MTPPNLYSPGTNLTVGSHAVQIVKYLSQGGFAHVYICNITPPFHGSTVACLKRVAVPTKIQLNLLRQEVDAMKRLRGNPTIVSYIDSHASRLNDNGNYEVFLLMEYCSGNGLIDFMNSRLSKKLTEPEILVIMRDITLAVTMCHHLQPPILHRDIKIENVLIDQVGTYKLCDFGSAVPYSPIPRTPQEANILYNDIMQHTTPQYRSPEMIDLSKAFPIDDKSDIWALGCFLYKLCYYTTPFELSQQTSLAELEQLISRCQLKIPPNSPGSMFSLRLKNMIKCCLREDPRRRPNGAQLLGEICSMMHIKVPNFIPASVLERPSGVQAKSVMNHYQSQSSPQLPIRKATNKELVGNKDPFASIDKSTFFKKDNPVYQPLPPIPAKSGGSTTRDVALTRVKSLKHDTRGDIQSYIKQATQSSENLIQVNDDTLDFLKEKELHANDTGGSFHKFKTGLRKISTGSSTNSVTSNHTGKRYSISSVKQLLTGGRKEEIEVPKKLAIQRRMIQYLNNTDAAYNSDDSDTDSDDIKAINSNSYKKKISPPSVPKSLSSERSSTPTFKSRAPPKPVTAKTPPPKPKKPIYLRTPENDNISVADLDDLEKQFAKRFPSYV